MIKKFVYMKRVVMERFGNEKREKSGLLFFVIWKWIRGFAGTR